jgi:signal transduction histidine kinase
LEPKLVLLKAEPVMQEIQLLFQPRLEQQSIKLNLESTVDVRFRADAQQLKQVLINLVQNAAESIVRDGSITLRARQDKVPLKGRTSEVVIIEVEDNGPGIPPEVQERLFDPFFSTKKEGTGLGLTIAARIIDKHDGALEFKSFPGKATTFGVVLPAGRNGG